MTMWRLRHILPQQVWKCFYFVGSQFVGAGDECTLKRIPDLFLRFAVECVVVC